MMMDLYKLYSIIAAACIIATVSAQDDPASSGLAAFPGVDTIISTLVNGGLAQQLTSPTGCSTNVTPLSETCRAELATFPQTLEKIIALDLVGAGEEIPKLCSACDVNDVITWLDSIRGGYVDADKDLSCDGAYIPEMGDGQMIDLIKILLNAACVKTPSDKLCFGSDMLRTALPEGLVETIAAIDFTNLSPTVVTGLMGEVTNGNICRALVDGGCCSGMLLDIVKTLTELTCLNTPIINSALTVVTNICPDTPDSCDTFVMPAYVIPASCPEGGFQGLITGLEGLKPMSETAYGGCILEGCPKNDCQLFACTPQEA